MSCSLRRYGRSKKSRAGSLILQWKTPRYAGKVLALVEGWEDTLVYEKFFNSSNTWVKDCGGCANAIGINTCIKKVMAKQKSFVILDSDFRWFYGRNTKRANVFFTDTHDMETSVLFNSRCFQSLIQKLKCLNVTHNDIVKDLRLLSYMRWYNMDSKMCYTDKNLDIVNMSRAKITDYAHLITHFEPSSGSTKQWLKRCFNHFVRKHPRAKSEHLLNGHDYVARFCHYARMRDKLMLGEEDVLLGIAMVCDHIWFNGTTLGQQLRDWQTVNKVNVLS